MSDPTPEPPAPAPDVAAVRLLLADVGDDQYLTDPQVQGFLDLNDGHVRRAAADALDAIATSETLVSKVIRSQDLQTDGAKVADSLRKHADRLRQVADAADALDADIFDVVTIGSSGRTSAEGAERPLVWGL